MKKHVDFFLVLLYNVINDLLIRQGGVGMAEIVELSNFKMEKQYKEYYLENYKLMTNNSDYATQEVKREKNKNIAREMQLAYMKLLTKEIENKRLVSQ